MPIGIATGNLSHHDAEIEEVKRVLFPVQDKGCAIGVQIYVGPNDWNVFPQLNAKFGEMLDHVKQSIGENMWQNSSLHLPFACRKAAPEFHMTCDDSVEYMAGLVQIAQQAQMRQITLHPNTIYYMPFEDYTAADFLQDYQTEENFRLFEWGAEKKSRYQDFIVNVKLLAQAFPDVEFSYENMPLPIFGDHTTDGRQLRVEPNLVTPRSIEDFIDLTPPNVKLCFDPGHYLIARETLNYYATHPAEMTKHIQTLIGSLDPVCADTIPSVEHAVDIVERIKWVSLQELATNIFGSLSDVQVQDSVSPIWKPHTHRVGGRLLEEGSTLRPGQGFHQETLQLLKYLSRTPGLPLKVSFDVAETDYANRVNQENALRILDEI